MIDGVNQNSGLSKHCGAWFYFSIPCLPLQPHAGYLNLSYSDSAA